MKDSGERSVGEIRGRIIEIQHIDDDHVSVRDCNYAKTERLAADGSVVGTDDGSSIITGLRVVRTAEGWRVEDWLTGGHDHAVA